MKAFIICPCCNEQQELAFHFQDYIDWKDGKLIQEAFPYLSCDERELLISGYCVPCWDKIFSEDEDSGVTATYIPGR